MSFNSVAIIFSLFFLFACSSSKKQAEISQATHSPVEDEPYRALAVQKYLDHITYLFNSDKSAVVCAKQIESSRLNPFPRLDFFIYDIANRKLIFEDSVQSGKVTWSGENRIKVSLVPGVMPKNESVNTNIGYEYDIMSRRRIDKIQ